MLVVVVWVVMAAGIGVFAGFLPVVGVLALGMLAFLTAFHVKELRTVLSPWPARNLASLTVAFCGLVLAAFVYAIIVGWPWSPRHLWLALAAGVALVAVAYQWPTHWFRGFSLAVVLLTLGVLVSVGKGELEAQEARDHRVSLTKLDARLSEADLAGSIKSATTAIQQRLAQSGAVLTDEVKQASVSALTAAEELSQSGTAQPLQALADSAKRVADAKLTAGAAKPAQEALTDLQRTVAGLQELAGLFVSAQAEIAKACHLTGGHLEERLKEQSGARLPSAKAPEPCVQQTGKEVDLLDTAVYVASSERLLATLAIMLAPDAKAAALARAEEHEAEVALAEARTAQGDGRQVLGDLVTAISSGANAAVVGKKRSWTESTLFWLVVVAAAILGYRSLEILNSGLEPGPVAFAEGPKEKPGAEGEPKAGRPKAAVQPVLRYHLLTNLPEPGVQPGESMTDSITDLVSVEGVAGPILKAVMTLLKALGFPLRGYEVSVSLLEPPNKDGDGKARGAEVHVRLTIRSRRSQRTLKTITARAARADEALAEVAFQAAGWIITRARGVPPWMQRSEHAGSAYLRFETLKGKVETGSDERIEEMRNLVRAAPGNAEMLVRLGYELDLGGRYEEALTQYERAVEIWPDYGLARYRRAIARANVARLKSTTAGSSLKDFGILRRGLGWWHLANGRLSIRERQALPRMRDRRDARHAMVSAQAVPQAHESMLARNPQQATSALLAKNAYLRSRSAIVHYNMACYLAARGELSDAMDRLRKVLTCPNAAMVSGAWMSKDPDLSRLYGNPTFRSQIEEIEHRLPAKDVVD